MNTSLVLLPAAAPAQGRRPTRLGRVARAIKTGFAALGVGLTTWIFAGSVADFSQFDRTRGGYEAPYTGWSGTPIDWSIVDVSPIGFSRRGIVLDVLVDCTIGTIEMEFLGLTIPFRSFSERALVVHRPREACSEAGFNPQF